MSCGAETEAVALLGTLTAGISFTLPSINLSDDIYNLPGDASSALYSPVTRLTNDSLTTGAIDGPGTFDALMRGFKGHLREEYEKGRITNADYTKAYIELTQAAMQNSVQFLLGRETAFWAAQTAQLAAIIARVQLQAEKVKIYTLQVQALMAKAEYGLTTMKISTESMNYCLSKYNLDNILPGQLAGINADNATKSYSLTQILPAQKALLVEQQQVAYVQTFGARMDGSAVSGVLGGQIALGVKQRELYDQQIVSYKRDIEQKVAKLFGDIWTVQKTIDEGLAVPGALSNAGVDEVFATLRNNAGMG